MEILKVKNLNFTYPSCNEKALDDISFSIEKGNFVAVCGPTGSGKSTLLRLLKPQIAPLGKKTGEASLITENPFKIGFVAQNPEQQIVTDKVWHELAFGLENMGVETSVIKRRVAETASFFGIDNLFEMPVNALSGGQKQLLSLASVAAMEPEILILDEPTAQLDPIAASEFISMLKKLNSETGVTIIVSEHRLEEILPASNKLLALENGRVIGFGETKETVFSLLKNDNFISGMPCAVRLFSKFNIKTPCPFTINEGRRFIEDNCKTDIKTFERKNYVHLESKALEFDNVCFRYSKQSPDVLKNLSFTVYENEIFCILGTNGSGKTTALNCAAGLLKAYAGKIKVFSKKIGEYKNNSLYTNLLTMLPQDTGTVFLKNTVKEELEDSNAGIIDFPFDLKQLYDKHPYDISGGEQQLVALAKALSQNPKILLLDEPSKGLDNLSKQKYISVLKELKARGVTVVIVTHDVELAALCADRCALFFRGENVSNGTAEKFFENNNFFCPASTKMTKGIYSGVLTISNAYEMIMKNGGVKNACD